jgi:hypothetical protein
MARELRPLIIPIGERRIRREINSLCYCNGVLKVGSNSIVNTTTEGDKVPKNDPKNEPLPSYTIPDIYASNRALGLHFTKDEDNEFQLVESFLTLGTAAVANVTGALALILTADSKGTLRSDSSENSMVGQRALNVDKIKTLFQQSALYNIGVERRLEGKFTGWETINIPVLNTEGALRKLISDSE